MEERSKRWRKLFRGLKKRRCYETHVAVRLPPEWMSQSDERILEFLEKKGPHAPFEIEGTDEINYSRSHINKRLILLKESGFVNQFGPGTYSITSKGIALLNGNEDFREVEKPA